MIAHRGAFGFFTRVPAYHFILIVYQISKDNKMIHEIEV